MDKMMSQKEATRGQVMELLSAGKVDQKEGSHNAFRRSNRRHHSLLGILRQSWLLAICLFI